MNPTEEVITLFVAVGFASALILFFTILSGMASSLEKTAKSLDGLDYGHRMMQSHVQEIYRHATEVSYKYRAALEELRTGKA